MASTTDRAQDRAVFDWSAQGVAEFDTLMRPPLAEVYLWARHVFSPASDAEDENGIVVTHLVDRLTEREGRRDEYTKWELYYRASIIARMQHPDIAELDYVCLECFLNHRLRMVHTDCPCLPLQQCLLINSHSHL